MARVRRPVVVSLAIAMLAAVVIGVSSAPLGDAPAGLLVCDRLTTPAYERIDPTTGATLITTDPAEAQRSVTAGYARDLGEPYTVSVEPGSGLVSVHELISAAHGDRLYTGDDAVIRRALGNGYHDSGIAFYTAADSLNCTTPVHRVVKAGVSRYVAAPAERTLLRKEGWHEGGVAFSARLNDAWSWPIVTGRGPLDQPPFLYQGGDVWRAYRHASDDATRRLLYQIAATPTAIWLGGSASDGRAVAKIETEAVAQHTTPQFVLYAIPDRDCGGYAGGGLDGPVAYEQWIQEIRAGIAGRPTVVIVEPDAIGMSCLDPAQRTARIAMLRYAISTLAADPQTWVYIHAGSSRLLPENFVNTLVDVGVGSGRGLAINISGYGSTEDEMQYGDELVSELAERGVPGMHYVIDTSRNGLGRAPDDSADAAHSFCNQRGRALGQRPTPITGNDLADALLWIKRPGESDGDCFPGDPKSGWYQSYALDLVRRSLIDQTITELPLPR